MLNENQKAYREQLDSLDPARIGLSLSCPGCSMKSWLLLPEKSRYAHEPNVRITCPAACGHYADIHEFAPLASAPDDSFDIAHDCVRDGAKFRTFGTIYRCPVCAIENPREVMNSCAQRVLASSANDISDLSNELGSLVGTFDGVMRQTNRIACQNASASGLIHPIVRSFQDIASARNTLDGVIDISKLVRDWSQFNETFQKRHALSHSLGVIDQKYLNKTGVASTQLGRKVQLTRDQVNQFAADCQAIVTSYFGRFLS